MKFCGGPASVAWYFLAMADMSLEQKAGGSIAGPVAGIDEVGRGPLAGPVLAAAVIIPAHAVATLASAGLDDSKKLTARKRAFLFQMVTETCSWGVGAGSIADIDANNILGASLLAMRRAILAMPALPVFALVDGNRLPDLPCPAQAVIKGDSKSLSIAAASVVAKVLRDRAMASLGARYPGYGWERNAGYGTQEHREALQRLGPTAHHRRSFAPVAEAYRALTDSR